MLNYIKDRLKNKIKEDKANAVVENIIVLPIILLVIMLIIIMCFIVHDRSTVEGAAKRGAIYAAHCISNPTYADVLSQSGNTPGSLDVSVKDGAFTFTGISKKVNAYRYLKSTTSGLKGKVQNEVMAIVEKTRIPWRDIDIVSVNFEQNNKIYYQDVKVTVNVSYPISPVFAVVGMESVFDYSVSAIMTVNDPDEFIRNADMIVDLIVEIDNKTGNNISKITDKISSLASKVLDWLDVA